MQNKFDEFVAAYKQLKSIRAAGKQVGIPKSTAQNWYNKYKENKPACRVGKGLPKLPKKKKSIGIKHFVIPDVQVKPGQDWTFLRHVGLYIVETLPDVIIQIGDFADMESLSSYDFGKAKAEGKRVIKDLDAAHQAMRMLLGPIWEYNAEQRRLGLPEYKPRMVLTLGNHEERIERACNDTPALQGFLTYDCLKYKEFGWEVVKFLEPIFIDGVAYCHYFTSGVMGRPVGSARMLVTKKMMSCVQGHIQADEIYSIYRADKKRLTGILAGTCYEHYEGYLGPQGNNYFRGVWVLHEVNDGQFEPMPITLRYLRNKYED